MGDLVTQRRPPAWPSELLVDGAWEPGRGDNLDVFEPASGSILATIGGADASQVDRAVAAARKAFETGDWARLTGRERGTILARFADRLASLHDELTAGVVCEVGSPVTVAGGLQTQVAVSVLRTYAELAAVDRTVDLGVAADGIPSRSIVALRPVGVVAVVTAYNMPLLLAARAMGAALAAGCTTVLLPSPRAPLTSIMMAKAAMDAGVPAGVVNVVVGGPDVGKSLCTSAGIDKVAFTGSLAVGRQIMAQAAPAIRRLSLELGGKSPSIIMPGYDFRTSVQDIHIRYLRNGGQGCAAPARILVPQDDYDEFAKLSADALTSIKTGDPWDEDTVVGPLIRPEHRADVRRKVDDALSAGATLVAEGPPSARSDGWYMSPVVVGGVDPLAPIAQEELFGPVGVLLPYRDLDEAVSIANGTAFGLSANVYCDDPTEGIRLAERLHSGTVAINGGGAFRPDAPFGGFKASGFGREYGEWGVREFLEVQHVQWAL